MFVGVFLESVRTMPLQREEKRHGCGRGREAAGIYNHCDAQGGLLSVCVWWCVLVLFIVFIGVIRSEQPTAVSERHAAMQHVNHQHASWPPPRYTPAVTLCVCVCARLFT